MKKLMFWVVLLTLCGSISHVPALALGTVGATGEKKKILMVVSNRIDMGDAARHDARNNLWEYAPPYHVFLLHGYEVDFVSPLGGAVEFNMDPLGISAYAIKYENFLGRASASLSPDQVQAADYAGVFIGGGYGTLFDVAGHGGLMRLMAEIYEQGGVIGGGGHGPGAFADVKLSDGRYLVAGKRVAGFPNATEITKSWADQGRLLPFMVEDRLRENGARVVTKETITDKHEVIVDGRIVSTMFLPSAALVAREMIRVRVEGTQ